MCLNLWIKSYRKRKKPERVFNVESNQWTDNILISVWISIVITRCRNSIRTPYQTVLSEFEYLIYSCNWTQEMSTKAGLLFICVVYCWELILPSVKRSQECWDNEMRVVRLVETIKKESKLQQIQCKWNCVLWYSSFL